MIGTSSDSAGFYHFRKEDDSPRSLSKPTPPKSNPSKPKIEWGKQATSFQEAIAKRSELLQRLAEKLRVPPDALLAVGVGMQGRSSDSVLFTFPESDSKGEVIGIATRTERNEQPVDKLFIKGGKRGLILPAKWDEPPGPVLLVEGPTDTAAMVAAGLCVVGRPSNTGGVQHLAKLLTGWPIERGIVVVGENDAKESGGWPGREGAEQTARGLSTALNTVVRWSLPPEGSKDVREWLTASDREGMPWPERGKRLLEHLTNTATELLPCEGKPKDVLIGTDEHRVNTEAAEALGTQLDIYQRGGILVRILEHHQDPNQECRIRREEGEPILRELSPSNLRESLTRCVNFQDFKGDEIVSAHPPVWCVKAIHERGTWMGIRRLESLVNHPVLLPNGSILASNGFDANSGLFVCIPPNLTIEVPSSPTREDVAKAVETIGDVIRDFPFQTPAHRAAWFAAFLTPLAWFAFEGPAPWFLIDGNVRGVGKGLLADVIALTLTGRRFAVMSYTNDREELRKRITTLAIEGDRLVLLDNLAGGVGNDILDGALTTDRWKDRILGGNRRYDGPLYVTWFGTGNNVQLQADTSRRVCHIRMESAEEKPEQRRDVKYPDLRSHVRANRAKLLSAALTILRGWVVAGRPKHNLPPWGSFEGWSNVVREAVVFAGLTDPGETREELQSLADRDAAAMGTIIGAFPQLDPNGRGITTADIIRRIKEAEHQSDWLDELRSAVEELCGKLDARSLGYKFRHFNRGNFGGWSLESTGSKNANRWVIRSVSSTYKKGPHLALGGDAAHEGYDSGRLNSSSQSHTSPERLLDYRNQMLPD